MSAFWMRHPVIALIMMGMVCVTIVDTADIIASGKRKVTMSIINKKEDTKEEVESVEE